MAAWVYDSVGTSGVILCLLAFLLLQVNKIDVKSLSYGLLNLIGAITILFSLVHAWNLSAFLMEVSWALISLYGILKHPWVKPKPRP